MIRSAYIPKANSIRNHENDTPFSHFIAIATFVSATTLFGSEVPTQQGLGTETPVDATKTPKGLSDADWSGIRGAYERGRHAIVANLDGTHQARNPGQAWLTRFDGRGFTVTPDTVIGCCAPTCSQR